MNPPPAGLSAPQLRDAIEAVAAAFDRAAASTEPVMRYFRVGGHLVRITFAGCALAQPLSESFEHLAASPGEPELEIRAFDSESTGVPIPLSHQTLESMTVAAMPSAQPSHGLYGDFRRLHLGLSSLNCEDSKAWYWLPSLDQLQGRDRGAPFRAILSWWMPSRGKRFIHAGAVGSRGSAALISGPGGAGKSTTTLTCLANGMDYLGDDYCLFSPEGTVHSLYRSVKLRPGHAFSPTELGRDVSTGIPGDDKSVFFPAPRQGGAFVDEMRIAAIILPTVTGAPRPSLHPASPGTALAAIAPSTLLQLSSGTADAMRDFAALCQSVPSYRLELGDRADLIPDIIHGVLP